MRRRVALAVAAVLACGGVQAAIPTAGRPATILAATPISRLDLPWWRARFAAKAAELRAGPVELAFYGDSITEDWEHDGPAEWARFRPVWQHFYGDRHAVNLGFKGDTTANLLWRIEHGEAEGIAPKVAVLLIGANNLGRVHWGVAETLAGIDADIAALHRHMPRTRIVLLPILPGERSPWVTQTTEAVNHALATRYANDPVVTYVDVTGIFLHEGEVDRSQFLDPYLTPPDPPLHPTAQAQGRIATALEPVLSSLLGDHNHATR